MTFPDSPRVIYSHDPLETVICQLRFPPILKIDAEIPASFQELIRHEYPLFTDRLPDNEGLEIPPEIAKLMSIGLQFQGGKRKYEFSTSDELWQVTLTRDFLALTTKKYERWEDFKRHLDGPVDALLSQYGPDFYVRIGLRYRNLIKRSQLEVKDCSWSELLQPHVAGELASEIHGFIRKAGRELLIELEGKIGHVKIKHGIINAKDSSEDFYLIDADFYTDQQTEIGHAISRLDRFNKEAGHLFRWCITDRLHSAMGPRSI